jgi:hypothetical protein
VFLVPRFDLQCAGSREDAWQHPLFFFFKKKRWDWPTTVYGGHAHLIKFNSFRFLVFVRKLRTLFFWLNGGIALTYGKNVAFYTLGCKLNFSEICTQSLQDEGFDRLILKKWLICMWLTRCSVTENADKSNKWCVGHEAQHLKLCGCGGLLCIIKPRGDTLIKLNLVLGATEKFHYWLYQRFDKMIWASSFVRDCRN